MLRRSDTPWCFNGHRPARHFLRTACPERFDFTHRRKAQRFQPISSQLLLNFPKYNRNQFPCQLTAPIRLYPRLNFTSVRRLTSWAKASTFLPIFLAVEASLFSASSEKLYLAIGLSPKVAGLPA